MAHSRTQQPRNVERDGQLFMNLNWCLAGPDAVEEFLSDWLGKEPAIPGWGNFAQIELLG